MLAQHAGQGRSIGLAADVIEASKMALRSLRVNLFRTCLTLLGIIIGVGAVVAMLAIGSGSKREVLARIEAMGTDLLVIRPAGRGVRTTGDVAALTVADAAAIADLPNVEVTPFSGLAVRFVRSLGGHIMLRGIRTTSDMEYEFTMSLTNLALDSEIETVFLMAKETYSHISSSLLRQIAALGGDLEKFVPPQIKDLLLRRAQERRGGTDDRAV